MSKSDKHQVRIQGDVILREISKLPENCELIPRETKAGQVLQFSEVTGHHHHFREADLGKFEVYARRGVSSPDKTITEDGFKYVHVLSPEGVYLYHGKNFVDQPSKTGVGDHDVLHLLGGRIYEVKITREFDAEREEDSVVRD